MSQSTEEGRSRQLVGGRYRLLGLLGRGGMGQVWRALDEALHREVAVKEVTLPSGHDDEHHRNAYERARREAQTAARITHPAVVNIHDVADGNDRLWIVMELITGRSLDSTVRTDGALSVRETARIGLELAAALEVVHRAGVVHRDVKPANVQLEPEGRVVLMDFGIAALEDPDTTLTQTGVVIGTPGYMGPERIRGNPPHPASDMWSLGATLLFAMTGRAPFERDSPIAVMHAVLYVDPEIPDGPLRPLVSALLAKAPEVRPTASEARAALAGLVLPPDPVDLPDPVDPPVPAEPQDPASRTVAFSSSPGGKPRSPHDAPVQDAVPEVPLTAPEETTGPVPSPLDTGKPPGTAPPVARSYIPRKPITAFGRPPNGPRDHEEP